jgi:hypothetical protein
MFVTTLIVPKEVRFYSSLCRVNICMYTRSYIVRRCMCVHAIVLLAVHGTDTHTPYRILSCQAPIVLFSDSTTENYSMYAHTMTP